MAQFFGGFPFGGGGGGGDFHGSRKRKDVNTTELYEVLGVAKDATPDEIKRAYKKLAVKHHPDKGGDEAKFKEITEAADVLLDEDKRRVYDEHGKEGLQAGLAEGGGGAEDLLSSLFGGGGFGGQREQRRREIAPITRKIEVTLTQLYNGATTNVTVERKRICQKCSGSGANKPNAETECDDCRGRGVKIAVKQIAPGFVQQFQMKCDKCEGGGTYIPKKFQCQGCKGEKLITETVTYPVEIQKGMSHGEKITISGEGHHVPSLPPGDIVVVLVMAADDKFVRKGNDLLLEFKVSLTEALDSSKNLSVEHLDGRHVTVTRPPGYIIRPGVVTKLEGEGMPKPENPNLKGDLYLRFTIVFPTSLPEQEEKAIVAALTPYCPALAAAPEMKNDDDLWESRLQEVDLNEFGRRSRKTREAYAEENDDDEQGQGGVQCQQM